MAEDPSASAIEGLPAGAWQLPPHARVTPAERGSLGLVARVVLRLARRRTGAAYDYNVVRTFARLGGIFPAHALFLSQLLFKGRLSRTEKELVILRVAWRRGCAYEWAHHVDLAIGLAVADNRIDAMSREDADVGDPRLRALIQAADELVAAGTLTDEAWSRLRDHCSPEEAMELCLLVGHYVMVAMTINAVGIQLEEQATEALRARARARAQR